MFWQHCAHRKRHMCTHYFSDDMLQWYFKQEWKKLRSLAFQPISNCCKYRSHSAGTVLIQQVPFSGSYFDGRVPSLQIRITILFSTDLKRLVQHYWAGFPATLPVFQNVSTHFLYTCAHSVPTSFTRCRLNRRKLTTHRGTRPPSWENGTWQVPSQLPHSEYLVKIKY